MLGKFIFNKGLQMKFTKLHGAGNDFIIVEMYEIKNRNISEVAKAICHRNYGVGADGFMVPVDHADCIEMLFYNTDGSLAEMCGNGLRCFVKYIVETRKIKEPSFKVKTPAGYYSVTVEKHNYLESVISINMGKKESYKPLESADVNLVIGGLDYSGTIVTMGVPHLVLNYWPENEEAALLGSRIEKDSRFTKGTNVNFVRIIDKNKLEIKTWERGAGLTLACGTGACASAAVLHDKALINHEVELKAPGGILRVEINNEIITLIGEARLIAIGDYIEEV
jgi:diaminopimelate epimerase